MQKNILLKITGAILLSDDAPFLDRKKVENLGLQIKELSNTYRFSIVIGGGNFFRGSQQGKKLSLTPSVGHQVGMVATMMNGLIIQDIFQKQEINTCLFCAISCPQIGKTISIQAINEELNNNKLLIFSGGTGNPYFTTDTNAVLKALQTNTETVWKVTDVDGVYTQDPKKYPNAKLLNKITYKYCLDNNLNIIDKTAYILAEENNLPIRVFNGKEDNCLLKAVKNKDFGSIITK